VTLAPLPDPNTNIYTTTIQYPHYPQLPGNVGFYKFFISGNGAARDGGWEDPISNAGGNRGFSITSSSQTNRYYYNDEDPKFKIYRSKRGCGQRSPHLPIVSLTRG